MAELTLKAHFDGHQILLDEPCDLKPGTPVIITVIPDPVVQEQAAWVKASTEGLVRAYSSDEPDYTPADIKQ